MSLKTQNQDSLLPRTQIDRRGFLQGMVGVACTSLTGIGLTIPTLARRAFPVHLAFGVDGREAMRLKARFALCKWAQERIDEDMIAALSGL